MTESQSPLLIFLNVVSRVIPALLTRMSTGPTSLAIRATHSLQELKSATSTGYALNSRPLALCGEPFLGFRVAGRMGDHNPVAGRVHFRADRIAKPAHSAGN